MASLSESQQLTGSPTLIPGHAPGDGSQRRTSHLQAVPLAALRGETHDAWIRHEQITSNSVCANRNEPLQW
jgi:hypothetical protein